MMEKKLRRLAELITIFYDCRVSRGVETCTRCMETCPHKDLHKEYNEIIEDRQIFETGIKALKQYLRPDVKHKFGWLDRSTAI